MKKVTCLLLSFLMISTIFVGCSSSTVQVNETEAYSQTSEVEETTSSSEAVTLSSDVIEMASDTQADTDDGKDIGSSEIIEGSEEKEKTLEPDAKVEQENVAYNGSSSGNGLKLLGKYQGLTYYNQADSRWANKLYTSTGNKTQTMASSACGPTSAAMVVSSSKGAILPTTMASLFVDNGYRTANNGTAWACWPFVADYFGFDEYYATTSDSKMLSYLKTDKNKDGVSDYFVVASCNSGLWTTGGHYIVLVADNDSTITVYDPYLYSGKFNTASRRAANVRVSGNSAFVSESNFKKYSNTVQYWIFSNDSGNGGSSSNPAPAKSVNYTRYVATQSAPLNVRSGAGTKYAVKSTLSKGTKVTVTKTSGAWSYISSPVTGWVSSSYLSASKVNSGGSSTAYKSKIGSSYKLKTNTTLYSKANLSGTKYQYLKNTTIKVLSHYSSTVDYVYIPATGRYAYCKVSAFTNAKSSSISYSTAVGKTYTLKSNTTLYSRSNLTGTQYQYLKNTTLKVISHSSAAVDYIQVIQTGRKAYVSVSKLK